MKLFLLKDKRCFDKKKPWYGIAGDMEIAGVVAAETKEEAFNLIYKEIVEKYKWESIDDYQARLIKERKEFDENWTAEELTVPKTKEIKLLTFGEY